MESIQVECLHRPQGQQGAQAALAAVIRHRDARLRLTRHHNPEGLVVGKRGEALGELRSDVARSETFDDHPCIPPGLVEGEDVAVGSGVAGLEGHVEQLLGQGEATFRSTKVGAVDFEVLHEGAVHDVAQPAAPVNAAKGVIVVGVYLGDETSGEKLHAAMVERIPMGAKYR